MHVLWVNDFAHHAGGAEHYMTKVATRLRARGVTNSLLYGVEAWTAPDFTKVFDGAYPLAAPAAQVRALAPDVVFVHQLEDPVALGGLQRGGAPVVRFLHDYHLFCLRDHKYTALRQRTCTRVAGLGCYPCLGFVFRTTKDRGRAGERRGFRLRTLGELRLQQAANRRLDGWIVGSSYMKEHAAAHGFSPARIHHLDLFVDLPETGEETTGAALHRDRCADRLLFVGAMITAKGLDLLLRALCLLPGVPLDVVGGGPQLADYQAMAGRLGVAERVTFYGQQPPAALVGLYRRAACMVVPGRYPETFGFVGPEAMLHGAPVVAARIGGAGEWLHEGRTGRGFPSGDVPALAQAIRTALDDPAGSRAMAERGRAMVRERFRIERHVDRLLERFEALASAGRTTR